MAVSHTDRDHDDEASDAEIVIETYTSTFAVMRVEGPLSAGTVPRLVGELEALRAITAVVLDMTAVTFVCPAAAQALDAFARVATDVRAIPPVGHALYSLHLLAPDLMRPDPSVPVALGVRVVDGTAA